MMTRLGNWKTMAGIAALVALFGAGYLMGARAFEKPKSIIHLVIVKWSPESTPEQRQAAIDGVEKMAAEIPGIKRIWLKTVRVQPRDFNNVFAIEFEDQAAADRYAKHPVHEAWSKSYLAIRAESRSEQVTN